MRKSKIYELTTGNPLNSTGVGNEFIGSLAFSLGIELIGPIANWFKTGGFTSLARAYKRRKDKLSLDDSSGNITRMNAYMMSKKKYYFMSELTTDFNQMFEIYNFKPHIIGVANDIIALKTLVQTPGYKFTTREFERFVSNMVLKLYGPTTHKLHRDISKLKNVSFNTNKGILAPVFPDNDGQMIYRIEGNRVVFENKPFMIKNRNFKITNITPSNLEPILLNCDKMYRIVLKELKEAEDYIYQVNDEFISDNAFILTAINFIVEYFNYSCKTVSENVKLIYDDFNEFIKTLR